MNTNIDDIVIYRGVVYIFALYICCNVYICKLLILFQLSQDTNVKIAQRNKLQIKKLEIHK